MRQFILVERFLYDATKDFFGGGNTFLPPALPVQQGGRLPRILLTRIEHKLPGIYSTEAREEKDLDYDRGGKTPCPEKSRQIKK